MANENTPEIDYKALYEAERQGRLEITADVQTVIAALTPVVKSFGLDKGKPSVVKIASKIMDKNAMKKDFAHLANLSPLLQKYKHLIPAQNG